jgi:hypothetical protein
MTQRKRESPHTQSGITLELLPNHDFFLPNEKKKKNQIKITATLITIGISMRPFPFFLYF